MRRACSGCVSAGASRSRCGTLSCADLDLNDPIVIDTIVEQYKQEPEPFPEVVQPFKALLELEVEAQVAKTLGSAPSAASQRAGSAFDSVLGQFYSDYVDALDTEEGTYMVAPTGRRYRFERPFPKTRAALLARDWHSRASVLHQVAVVEKALQERMLALGVHEHEPVLAQGADGEDVDAGVSRRRWKEAQEQAVNEALDAMQRTHRSEELVNVEADTDKLLRMLANRAEVRGTAAIDGAFGT